MLAEKRCWIGFQISRDYFRENSKENLEKLRKKNSIFSKLKKKISGHLMFLTQECVGTMGFGCFLVIASIVLLFILLF